MVLINDKKFACATCIKGHRVSGCTHTDRPLFEVKKKGRPTTQCQHCRDKRKNGTANGSTVHTKCACGETPTPSVIMPGQIPTLTASASENESSLETQTKKGQPGSKATFPNGLKDVHDMAAAAEALHGMGTDDALKVAERKVSALLNPCQCATGGKCRCCQPVRERSSSIREPSPSPNSSGARTPTHGHVTDSLIEMFKAKATTKTSSAEASCCGSSGDHRLSISTNTGSSSSSLLSPRDQLLSPDFMHHPAHTSSHVHKTRLYSPYTTPGHMTPRNGLKRDGASPGPIRGGWASSSTSERPPPPKLRPLSDMNKFLGAVFREDGTLADSIPRSALGLPGIQSFVAMAQEGAAKPEEMEIDTDTAVQFPTKEDVVIGACTCGDDCECPSCATHGNAPASESNEHHCCGDNCKSSFDCADHLSLPKGITSIDHLLSFAAANVPHPAHRRSHDLHSHAHDTRILPPAVMVNEEAARMYGVTPLKPLECCNGRCQCPPGQCSCAGECCGCCMHCNCDDGDGDTKMEGGEKKGGCCSTTNDVAYSAPASSPSTSSQSSRRPSLAQRSVSPLPLVVPDPKVPSPAKSVNGNGDGTLPLASPGTTLVPSGSVTRGHSPRPSISSGTTLRRASSSSQQGSKPNSSSRRATITQGSTIQRAASTGKSASKALALHTTPNHPHPHPRPILPKPSAGQAGSKSCCGSGRNSASAPSGQTSKQTLAPASSSSSRDVSPAFGPTIFPDQNQQQFSNVLDPSQIPTISIPSIPSLAQNGLEGGDQDGLDPNITMSDGDIMALISQFAPSTDANLDFNGLSGQDPNFSTDTFGQGGQGGQDGQGGQISVDLGGGDNAAFFAQFMAALSGQQQQQDGSNQSQQRNPSPFDITSADAQNQNSGVGPGATHVIPELMHTAHYVPANGATSNEPAPVYQQLPPQSTAFLQQVFAHNPSFTTGDSSNQNGQSGQNGQNGQNGPTAESGKHNPDVIDLSKPLNSSDVERILRALHEQQTRQNDQQQPQSQHPSHPQPQHLQPPRSHSQSSVDNGGYIPTDLTYSANDGIFHNFIFGAPASDAGGHPASDVGGHSALPLGSPRRPSPEESKRMFYSLLQRGTGI